METSGFCFCLNMSSLFYHWMVCVKKDVYEVAVYMDISDFCFTLVIFSPPSFFSWFIEIDIYYMYKKGPYHTCTTSWIITKEKKPHTTTTQNKNQNIARAQKHPSCFLPVGHECVCVCVCVITHTYTHVPTADPWITQAWTVQVHVYAEFYSKLCKCIFSLWFSQ